MKYLKRKYLFLLENKLTEKIPDPRNAKEHYQLIIYKKEKQKNSKTSRNNY